MTQYESRFDWSTISRYQLWQEFLLMIRRRDDILWALRVGCCRGWKAIATKVVVIIITDSNTRLIINAVVVIRVV